MTVMIFSGNIKESVTQRDQQIQGDVHKHTKPANREIHPQK